MTHSDFVTMEIDRFSAEEIEATCAKLADVQASLMSSLNRLRNLVGQPFALLKNGLTTGNHASCYHGKGLAADVVIGNGLVTHTTDVLFKAIRIGFNGVGLYHNGLIYSWHFDLRETPSTWSAVKGREGTWMYSPLMVDPRVGR